MDERAASRAVSEANELIPAPTALDRALEILDRVRARPGLALAVLSAGLLGALFGWRLIAPDRTPIEEVLPFATTTPLPTLAETSSVAVHAAGAVARPGLYEMEQGSRVADLIDRAGGATPDADLSRVNLASILVDASQVFVPKVGESAPAIAGGPNQQDAPVDLNTASAEQLEELPGLGPALSAAIVEHRTKSGAFGTVDDLLAVSGIGPAKLDRIRELVMVS